MHINLLVKDKRNNVYIGEKKDKRFANYGVDCVARNNYVIGLYREP